MPKRAPSEVLLAIGHPELAAAAQAGHDAIAGDDDLVGHVRAEGAEHLLALLLFLDKLGRADAMDISHDHVPKCHSLGTVLLRQERVAESGGQHRAQRVVRLEVHSQFFPHRMTIDRHGLLLSLGGAASKRSAQRLSHSAWFFAYMQNAYSVFAEG
ncbi:MAG: hypothetical protein Q3963_05640, partial [Coriobacteriaceae bacterium]|nr:hypothetical protein [Coriobacteriaceae bacterium]